FFEVHLRNLTTRTQAGTLAFSFPGATPPGSAQTVATVCRSPAISGLRAVELVNGERCFLLGVARQKNVRFGGSLGRNGSAWASIGSRLPAVDPKDTGASASVDFSLEPEASQQLVFVLTWYAPNWQGDADKKYTAMYGLHFM